MNNKQFMGVQVENNISGGMPAIFRTPALLLFLFVVALLPRLFGLDRFLTSDENTNIFYAGSDVIAAFLNGDWRGTYWHFYPGVTMSWLDALGMGGQYLLDLGRGLPVPAFKAYIYSDILSLIVANRLPYAILSAAAVPAIYFLAIKLMPVRVALLGTLFLAFDPFYLAHSRVAHGDAPVAVFMCLSALVFFVHLQKQVAPKPAEPVSLLQSLRCSFNPYLIVSAVFGGLAALTKAPGQFMAIFIVAMSMLYAVLELRQTSRRGQQSAAVYRGTIYRWFAVIAVWGGVSLLTFALLWPSMWIDPVGTMQQMLNETFGKVEEGHLVYFFGQPTLDPGLWFYLYVIPFRLTPIVLPGVLLSLALFVPKLRRPAQIDLSPPPGSKPVQLSPFFLLWLFTILLLLFGNLSPKKQDRYLLPLFPFLNLLAAVGWVGVINLVTCFIRNRQTNRLLSNTLVAFILLGHLLPVITYYPYYLTYFNPLMGGPKKAAQTTLVGWGEGMEQVAAYLNSKDNAKNLYVASTPSQTLLPYFAGTGENFYTNDIAFRADYVVLYLAQMQRLAPSPEIVRYFQAQEPETVIKIQGVDYAKIYPNARRILTDIPPEAIPANIGLGQVMRLAGYKLETGQPEITLYWHSLASPPANYTLSVRATTVDGHLLAQQDQWPVNGLLPTRHWRQGDYVVDSHWLDIAATDLSKIHQFEIVVYNASTGQPLGAPIVISNE